VAAPRFLRRESMAMCVRGKTKATYKRHRYKNAVCEACGKVQEPKTKRKLDKTLEHG
jgi:hypothetical protein